MASIKKVDAFSNEISSTPFAAFSNIFPIQPDTLGPNLSDVFCFSEFNAPLRDSISSGDIPLLDNISDNLEKSPFVIFITLEETVYLPAIFAPPFP